MIDLSYINVHSFLGNENNFVSLDECINECTQTSRPVIVKLPETQNACELDRDIGPCKAYFEKYYYNKQTKTCEKFGWGGCKGNANKFNDKEECELQCVLGKKDLDLEITQKITEIKSEDSIGPKKLSSVICQLKKDTGYCKAYFPKFYFNSSTKRCEAFVWGGCGGKLNFKQYIS
jgi:hypothetical protein